jgi:hypothetical protein
MHPEGPTFAVDTTADSDDVKYDTTGTVLVSLTEAALRIGHRTGSRGHVLSHFRLHEDT